MSKDNDTVYLVDGSSYIYRAYHAIRGLSNSRGFPTNAVFGFTKMILKLLDEKDPAYLAIVFDSRGPTFRHRLYKDYKANRPPMPEEMAVQIPVLKDVVRGMGIRMFELAGFEADDIIGTWARICEERGMKVVMVTGDKDFRQIVSPQVSMWDTMKDKVIDYRSLKQAYRFEPPKFIDVMGLSGDQSDNIPGVPGVGEKTAVGLIQDFGSFENLYERIDEIKRKKLRENLETHRDMAYLSRELVTIDRYVPVQGDMEDLRIGRPSAHELGPIFRDLEFGGLWDQFASGEKASKDYRLCLSKEELKALTEGIRKAGILSIDTETTGKDPLHAELVGLSFSFKESEAWYLPLGHRYMGAPEQVDLSGAISLLREVLEDEQILKVGQNIKYDAQVLKRHGVNLKGINFDTMIASYVINPGIRQHNLDYLARHYLNHKMISFEDVVGKGKKARNFSEVSVEKACEYSCEDADITLRLMPILDEKMRADKNERLFYDLEMKLLPVLMDMEMTGIRIDARFFNEMSIRFGQEMKEIEKAIYAEAGMEFNINSSQQLGYVLFEKLGLPGQKKTAKTGRYSTDVKVLKKLSAMAFRIPELLLRYRTLSKLKSTYLDSLVKLADPFTGRIHTSYNQTVTATGRLSSSNPNLQNIPIRGEEGREIRKGFVAEEGHHLVAADYSQIELRVFAHYSGDQAFIEAFLRDQDIHSRTASEILDVELSQVTQDMRRIAKAINFGIIYGMGPRKLSEELGIDLKTARDYIAAYYNRYDGVKRFRDEMIRKASENGYVTTLFDRRRYLPSIRHGNNRIRSEAERMAINTPIQGTAADLIKKAMINIHARLEGEGFRSKMLLQVHDELVFETPEEELERLVPMVREEMEGVFPLKVPLKVDINRGRNWDEAH
ncbi:MAG: DNA polymerase I [Deltaproteobacteria bacterium]|nr:DNA polymerase I [Deltaproteobacteria bacterium]MBW2047244.1 DNA polymerase I [Deltaproteobacteria bacterium]MBW2353982.1 DNA polymerase I [Deltaproteobacteria bacterium]HDZ89604.1 DNA polymerase I [Deltaproteobacteria bacterium]